MGLFSFLFRKTPEPPEPPKISIQHAYFGPMNYAWYSSDKTRGYFHRLHYFAPALQKISISMDTDTTGPTSEQTDFFKMLEERYESLLPAILPVLIAAGSKRKKNFMLPAFPRDFRLLDIHIYAGLPAKSSISFESDLTPDNDYCIEMTDFEPVSAYIT
jgi:hypothetical protein